MYPWELYPPNNPPRPSEKKITKKLKVIFNMIILELTLLSGGVHLPKPRAMLSSYLRPDGALSWPRSSSWSTSSSSWWSYSSSSSSSSSSSMISYQYHHSLSLLHHLRFEKFPDFYDHHYHHQADKIYLLVNLCTMPQQELNYHQVVIENRLHAQRDKSKLNFSGSGSKNDPRHQNIFSKCVCWVESSMMRV